MKKFLKNSIIWSVSLLVGSVLFLMLLASVPNKITTFSHEMNVVWQIKRMQEIKTPKIIIIGGSGCGFGLCSPKIRDYFNIPVCNTGTHAGLGLLTQMNICKDFIHEGDVVILIPEYENYLNNGYLGDITVLRIFTSSYPDGYKKLSVRQRLYLLQYVPSAFEDAWKHRHDIYDENDNGPYSRNALNEEGDVNSFRQYIDNKEWIAKEWEHPVIQKKAVTELQKYYLFCKKKHAVLLLFPPAYKAMSFDVNHEYIDMIWETLKEAQLPIVSSPERYRMNDTLHYDTDYHLSYEGAVLRTNMLIADIDSALLVNKFKN